jgi:hypothetical protein
MRDGTLGRAGPEVVPSAAASGSEPGAAGKEKSHSLCGSIAGHKDNRKQLVPCFLANTAQHRMEAHVCVQA